MKGVGQKDSVEDIKGVGQKDSDHEEMEDGGGDTESDSETSGHPLHHFHSDLDSTETGTVRRRAKTIVTPQMAMESFRLSFLNDDQDVNFDAILGELYELESQLHSAQTELSRSLAGKHPPPPAAFQDGGHRKTASVSSEQQEFDQLTGDNSRSLPQGVLHHSPQHQSGSHYSPQSHQSPQHQSGSHYSPQSHQSPQHRQHYHVQHYHWPASEGLCDTAETDSAFSDNTSLPSSESLTSMVTVSSSADTASSSSVDTCGMGSALFGLQLNDMEHSARLKAEKIRIALEKIREAKIRKLFVRAFTKDGSSKSILVDEKMTVAQVCSQLAEKNHLPLNYRLSVVELMPELLMERVLEDHDSLVENIVMWTRDSKNKIMFEERADKYDLFINPEKYLLSGTSSSTQETLTTKQKDKLLQEFFAPDNASVPVVEGSLYLKSDGKKAWKKYYFVLRASGLYYSPKGKVSKNAKDLACLVQFEFVEVYRGLGWKKKYHSPTDFCFALKHPQIQKKTSKYIRYFCAETDLALDQWVTGIRTVKLGKQILHNYEQVIQEAATWDLRHQAPVVVDNKDPPCQSYGDTGTSSQSCGDTDRSSGGRMTTPEPASLLQTSPQSHTPSIIQSSGEIISIDVLAIPAFRQSDKSDLRSLSGSVGNCSVGSGVSETGHKTPVKRVSFSATPCIINGSSSDHPVKHRDSIISASTDSSDDSNSSGETRLAASLRGKLRPRLPVTTETTRQLADMCNVSLDEAAEAVYADSHYRSSTCAVLSRGDKKRASLTERRGSCGSSGSDNSQRSMLLKHSFVSTSLKQHSLDSGVDISSTRGKVHSPAREDYYQHVRRKSEPLVVPNVADQREDVPAYTCSPSLLEEQELSVDIDRGVSCLYDHVDSEPVYGHIRKTPTGWSQSPPIDTFCAPAIPPPPEFRESIGIYASPGQRDLTPSPPPPSPPPPDDFVDFQSMHMNSQPPPLPTEPFANWTDPTAKQQQQHPVRESTPVYKSSPPPTLPKPPSSHVTTSSNTSPLHSALNKPRSSSLSDSTYSSRVTSSSTIASSENEANGVSVYSQRSPGRDSSSLYSSVSPHVPHKFPPPTLPKTCQTSSPSSPGLHAASAKNSARHLSADIVQASRGDVASDHELDYIGTKSTQEPTDCPPQSPSLPLLSDHTRKPNSDSSDEINLASVRNGHPSSSPQQQRTHQRSASVGGGSGKTDKKQLPPPPPPKRSENTRLLVDSPRQAAEGVIHMAPSPSSVPTGAVVSTQDAIYENFDGIMDIDLLPPPPPELLLDLPPPDCASQHSGSFNKCKPPPPPPKRSKETQLSYQ